MTTITLSAYDILQSVFVVLQYLYNVIIDNILTKGMDWFGHIFVEYQQSWPDCPNWRKLMFSLVTFVQKSNLTLSFRDYAQPCLIINGAHDSRSKQCNQKSCFPISADRVVHTAE